MKWERKKKEHFNLALIAKDKEDEWYIENICLIHMTGDQNIFSRLKEKGGIFAFGDNSS